VQPHPKREATGSLRRRVWIKSIDGSIAPSHSAKFNQNRTVIAL
jgi:hypothetical protein